MGWELIFFGIVAVIVLVEILKTAIIVPQKADCSNVASILQACMGIIKKS